MTDRMIFQLGTNNWQRGGEFAPGSGILHEAHHRAYNDIDGVDAYSVYPSRVQRFEADDVKVFELDTTSRSVNRSHLSVAIAGTR